MVSLTLSVSKELKQKMDEHKFTNWSAVARDAIEKQVTLLDKFRELTKNSRLTEDDAIKLGRLVNKNVAKRHGL